MRLHQLLIDMILKQLGNGYIPEYITIFGAGHNGLLLNKMLKQSNVKVNFFCDNDLKKQGVVIDGVPCVSLEELCEYRDSTAVFVSPYECQDIIIKLKEKEFRYIVPSEFMQILRFIPYTNNPNAFRSFPPIGHYYSLYPDIDVIMEKSKKVFDKTKEVLDIDFNETEQLSILKQMGILYSSIPKWEDFSVDLGATPLRYRLGNPSLSPGDAVGLHCMLRILKPRKMIEVGSGYTSAVILDTNEYYLENRIQLTFIEPYPGILKSVIKNTDKIKLIEKPLQDVPLAVFEELDSGDCLFIDSTHVSKIDSDVNYLFFEIFPRLKSGVYIHLHDIFYPFEYPQEWIFKGMIWNELYLLRALLQNNSNYSIVFFQNMMEQKHMDIFQENWPLNTPIHGGSIWLRKNKKSA